MYSPQIRPEKVKRLYLIAKSKGLPMTALVDEILEDYLKQEEKSKKEHVRFNLQ